MRVILWLATMLFFVAFFSYGYVLWSRSKQRRAARSQEEQLRK
jgi:cbb3-type cytochrome oxidase subunit 3